MIEKIEGLEFREDGHVYTMNGFALPSVTEIMKPLEEEYYGGINAAVLNAAADRGTEVHEAMENYALYGIEEISEDRAGYFEGLKGWFDEAKPEPMACEYAMCHRFLGYAGKADMVCLLDGKVTLVDYKTTSKIVRGLTRVQLEAYAQALKSQGIAIERKMIVQVTKEGKVTVDEYEANDKEAWQVFSALLNVRNFAKKELRK